MKFAQLIRHFQSQAAAARALKCAQPSVWMWQKKGIPVERQAQVELMTEGKLRADLPEALMSSGLSRAEILRLCMQLATSRVSPRSRRAIRPASRKCVAA